MEIKRLWRVLVLGGAVMGTTRCGSLEEEEMNSNDDGGGAGPELFAAASPQSDDPALFHHGVVPHSTKRRLYLETLEAVVFPGFEHHGIDTTPARAWLHAKSQTS